jgi:DNA-binding NtrC family response regulator
MPGPSGLVLIEKLIELDPNTRIVMLTGYASIATAIEAIKLGAIHYLAKPCDADRNRRGTQQEQRAATRRSPVTGSPLSVDRLEWEHIQRVLAEQQGNVSATARALKMHRRTLQRKLGKRPSARVASRASWQNSRFQRRERMRIDKWLWAARFYKTRSLAAQAIAAGHVRLDGHTVKPRASCAAA